MTYNKVRCISFATYIDSLVGDDATAVLEAVSAFGITSDDFRELDERPGEFRINLRGYTDPGSRWHRRLRVMRNDPDNNLFDRLRATDTKEAP